MYPASFELRKVPHFSTTSNEKTSLLRLCVYSVINVINTGDNLYVQTANCCLACRYRKSHSFIKVINTGPCVHCFVHGPFLEFWQKFRCRFPNGYNKTTNQNETHLTTFNVGLNSLMPKHYRSSIRIPDVPRTHLDMDRN